MTEINQVYKCSICGNVVTVLDNGAGELVCCGKPMDLLEERTASQEGKEKHVPVIEVNGDKVKVKVGSMPHPMEEKHFIAIIQVLKDGKVVASKQLGPGYSPEAEFCLKYTEGLKAREYCNLHGLWTN